MLGRWLVLASLVFGCSAQKKPTTAPEADPTRTPASTTASASPEASDPRDDARRGHEVGDRAPEFTLTSLDGQVVPLAEALRAGPVALVFGSYT